MGEPIAISRTLISQKLALRWLVRPCPSPPLPEPSTWALMLFGIGGIGLMLRRAKRISGFKFKDAFKA